MDRIRKCQTVAEINHECDELLKELKLDKFKQADETLVEFQNFKKKLDVAKKTREDIVKNLSDDSAYETITDPTLSESC